MALNFITAARRIIAPHIKSFARPEPEEHTDALPKNTPTKSAKQIEKEVRSAATRSFSQQAIRSANEKAARQVEAHSKGEFKKLGIKVDKEPELKWLVKGWIKDISERVNKLGAHQAKRLSDILEKGDGARHAETISREIEEQLGVTRSQADFIARDSVLTLNSKITRHRQKAAGFEFYIWTTMGDDRVRDAHEAIDGDVFLIDGDGHPEEGHPGEPENCFFGSTVLTRSNTIERAFRRWYDGKLTTLVTHTGETFESTPNHPVLTRSGWLPAHAVNVGEYVFDVRGKMAFFSEAKEEHRYPTLQETFETLALLGATERVLCGASQFHGDGGVDQEVDIVNADRGLLLNDEPIFVEKFRQVIFPGPFVVPELVARGRSFSFGLVGIGLAASGFIRALGDRLAIFERRLREAGYVGFTSIPGIHFGAHEEIRNSLSLSPVLLSEALNGGTLSIEIEALFFREVFGVLRRSIVAERSNTPSAKTLSDIVRRTAESGGDLAEEHPLFKHPLRIVENRSDQKSGHVFNLQTRESWYATSLACHNCRCVQYPLETAETPDASEEEQEDED